MKRRNKFNWQTPLVGLACLFMFNGALGLGDEPARAKTVKYEFHLDCERLVALFHKETFLHYIGHLDASGHFIEDRQYPRMRANGVPFNIPRYEVINWLTPKGLVAGREEVYEYRSGALLQGYLDASGNFVPKVGSKVIAFTEYQPGPDAIRIWNLPGKFVEVKRKGPQKP